MRTGALCLLIIALGAPRPVAAQQLVYGDTAVEIVGLRSWTAEAVEAAVQQVQPGLSLASHGCAVVLKESLGFADASVVLYVSGNRPWVVLTVVEPELAGLVRYAGLDAPDLPRPDAWAHVFEILDRDRGALNALQHSDFLLGRSDRSPASMTPAAVELRDAVRALNNEVDLSIAARSIRTDGDPRTRAIAALVLANFADRDSAWHLLAEAMRRSSDIGSGTARMVFGALAWTGEYTVDWKGAEDALTALMGGTSLFSYPIVLVGLAQTGVDPVLARALAAVNPDLLLSTLSARHPPTSRPARAFLVHSAGRDLGDAAAWAEWIRTGD